MAKTHVQNFSISQPSYLSVNFCNKQKKKLCWKHSRRHFLQLLPPAEHNILLTGDLDQIFYPFIYIWCYSYPAIEAPNPALQAHFQHILQFEDKFGLKINHCQIKLRNLLSLNQFNLNSYNQQEEADLQNQLKTIQITSLM